MAKKSLLSTILVLIVIGLLAGALLFPQIIKPIRKPLKFPILKARIDHVNEIFDGSSLTEFDLQGAYFGSVQGTRKVYFGSTPQSQVLMWTPTAISIVMPATLSYGQEHVVTIRQDSTIISNPFTFLVLRRLDGNVPSQGSAGQTITQYGFYLGVSQGSKVLKIGAAMVGTIVSWSNSAIVFTVPAGIAPGNYKICIMDGGKAVSNENDFTVL